MTEPFDKTAGLPAIPAEPPTPPAPLARHPRQNPAPAAPSPIEAAYPPRPIAPSYPPASATPPFNNPPYPAVSHPVPQGYAMPPGYPMPTISITQNNTGGAPIIVRRGTNHGLHLVLTLLTCGLWLPVWIILAIFEAMNRN
ncbi:hypothetical protein ACWEQ0_08185 [Nocardia thailandica]